MEMTCVRMDVKKLVRLVASLRVFFAEVIN